MRLPPFELHRPADLDAALSLLERYGDDGAFYMGGTELLLVMKLGLAAPEHLVDGKRLRELRGIEAGQGQVVIGAGTTHRELEHDPDVRQALPTLAELERRVANVRVRNAGTLGGNLCFAEPHSDPAVLLIALGATVDLVSTAGPRTVALEDFYEGPFMADLRPGEVMLRVRIPRPGAAVRIAYRRLVFRERPVVNAAVVSGGGPRVVVGAAVSRPQRVRRAEQVLAEDPSDASALADAAMSAVEPTADLDGSADYKRHLVGVVLRRAHRDLVA